MKLKAVEFLYLYLMPECPLPSAEPSQVIPKGAEVSKNPNKAVTTGRIPTTVIRSQDEKKRLLGKHLGNVQDLVDDLNESGSLIEHVR